VIVWSYLLLNLWIVDNSHNYYTSDYKQFIGVLMYQACIVLLRAVAMTNSPALASSFSSNVQSNVIEQVDGILLSENDSLNGGSY
jgi:hypothetical protein